ncbi:hypothetical protein, partial [Catenulispora rubra]|uniref:hypothetical protein n=1 Tax=Catenulispora rubra TaxID=280293 RepID=UPI00189203CE
GVGHGDGHDAGDADADAADTDGQDRSDGAGSVRRTRGELVHAPRARHGAGTDPGHGERRDRQLVRGKAAELVAAAKRDVVTIPLPGGRHAKLTARTGRTAAGTEVVTVEAEMTSEAEGKRTGEKKAATGDKTSTSARLPGARQPGEAMQAVGPAGPEPNTVRTSAPRSEPAEVAEMAEMALSAVRTRSGQSGSATATSSTSVPQATSAVQVTTTGVKVTGTTPSKTGAPLPRNHSQSRNPESQAEPVEPVEPVGPAKNTEHPEPTEKADHPIPLH